jgi:hypothetical protein
MFQQVRMNPYRQLLAAFALCSVTSAASAQDNETLWPLLSIKSYDPTTCGSLVQLDQDESALTLDLFTDYSGPVDSTCTVTLEVIVPPGVQLSNMAFSAHERWLDNSMGEQPPPSTVTYTYSMDGAESSHPAVFYPPPRDNISRAPRHATDLSTGECSASAKVVDLTISMRLQLPIDTYVTLLTIDSDFSNTTWTHCTQ